MSDFSTVGKSVPRLEGIAKVTGEAKYTCDMFLPRMLISKFLRSPRPHARIVHIDVERAKRLAGVKAVITGFDIPQIKFGVNENFPETWNQYALAIDRVRYVGDEVAAVAAVDEDTAIEALDLIEVEYEDLPAVFDPEEAMKPDAPKIHDDPNNIGINNVGIRTSMQFGEPLV